MNRNKLESALFYRRLHWVSEKLGIACSVDRSVLVCDSTETDNNSRCSACISAVGIECRTCLEAVLIQIPIDIIQQTDKALVLYVSLICKPVIEQILEVLHDTVLLGVTVLKCAFLCVVCKYHN